MFKRVPSDRTKADNDMLPIAPTSSPTIGNTHVVGSQSPASPEAELVYNMGDKLPLGSCIIINRDKCFLPLEHPEFDGFARRWRKNPSTDYGEKGYGEVFFRLDDELYP